MYDNAVVETPTVFPFVTFTNIEGKTFCIPRESIIHVETFQPKNRDECGEEKTYVNFKNPNPNKDTILHAVVDMPIEGFRDGIMKPAWEQPKGSD